MRILHVDSSPEWRGGQRQLQLLAAGLAGRGHEQAFAGPLPRFALPHHPLPAGNDPRGLVALRRAARGMDVVAAHCSHAHGLCVAAGLRPVVHRRVDFPVSGGWKYGRALGYVCVSEAVRAVLLSCGVSRPATVVYDGVRPLAAQAPAELGEGPVVLAVGALVDHKDHRTLAEAARGLDARVLVAGEGPLRYPELEHLGQRDDVAALLARAQVFVHSSKLEGLGQAVLEAMLAGCPVVATRAGGVPEVVQGAGLLVPVGDAAALREALGAALRGEHPSVEGARERARTFSVERMVQGTEEAYARFRGA